jgi:protein ImuB
MFASIHLPAFHLQCALRDDPDGDAPIPIAILEPSSTASERNKARILQLSPEALQQGVEPDMTATQGLARCAELLLLDRDLAAEAEAQSDLLACAESFTADFESTAPGTTTLDLHGNLLTPQSLANRAISWLAAARLTSSIGTADNPDLANLAARTAPAGTHQHIPDETRRIRQFLTPLPLESITASRELTETLQLWGIHTLGQLIALERSEVTGRLGPDAAILYDHAAGSKHRLLRLHRPPSSFAVTTHLEHEIANLDPLLFYIRRMLETISARLAASYLVAAEITLTLTFANKSNYLRQFRIPEPTHDADLLLGLLHTHLESFATKSPIESLALEAQPARPGRHQFDLFVSGLRDPNRFAETLARLEALLGPGRTGTPEPIATHRPDAFTLHPFKERIDTATPPEIQKRIGLPLRRFRPPVQANVTLVRHRPTAIQSERASGHITHSFGPYLTSTDWWQKDLHWQTQEWDIQLGDGGAYLLTNSQQPQNWHLQGVY